ncbi:MAG: hypothetical protein KGH57_01790 [Candidatus Micrarchaeota archaeon]|nr:hypothetical protein [Candidatus Micrarchaeota archaeon]
MGIPKSVEEHIRKHLEYPATKKEIQAQCTNMSEITDEDKAWVARLPERKYINPDEVLTVLQEQATA